MKKVFISGLILVVLFLLGATGFASERANMWVLVTPNPASFVPKGLDGMDVWKAELMYTVNNCVGVTVDKLVATLYREDGSQMGKEDVFQGKELKEMMKGSTYFPPNSRRTLEFVLPYKKGCAKVKVDVYGKDDNGNKIKVTYIVLLSPAK